METVVIEAEVPDAVAAALTHLAARDKALLRRAVSATVVEFAHASAIPASTVEQDSWNCFLEQTEAHAISGLPADFSVNHDHYLHGAPKREPAP